VRVLQDVFFPVLRSRYFLWIGAREYLGQHCTLNPLTWQQVTWSVW